MRFSLLFFDLDGTLIDSLGDIAWIVNSTMARYGYSEFSLDEVKKFIGFGTPELVKRALANAKPAEVPKPDEDEFSNTMMEIYKNNSLRSTACYDGVLEFLRQAKEQGIKNVILTNKNAASSEKVARELGLTPLVEEVIGPEKYGIKKPDPGVVHMIMERFNVAPEKALFVGDMSVDIQTARNAGITSVGVTYGIGEKKQLDGADHIIDSFHELKEIVGI